MSDLFETLEFEKIPAHVAKKFPALAQQEYTRAMEFIWLILSAIQWFESLSSVEREGLMNPAEMEALIGGYRQKLELFRRNPDEFVGP